MRAPVLGAWFARDPDSIVQQAHRSAEITHAHPEGIAGAIAVALAASLACRGDACPAGGAFLEAVLAGTPDGEVADGLRRALALGADEPVERAAEALGNGATEAAHHRRGVARRGRERTAQRLADVLDRQRPRARQLHNIAFVQEEAKRPTVPLARAATY